MDRFVDSGFKTRPEISIIQFDEHRFSVFPHYRENIEKMSVFRSVVDILEISYRIVLFVPILIIDELSISPQATRIRIEASPLVASLSAYFYQR